MDHDELNDAAFQQILGNVECQRLVKRRTHRISVNSRLAFLNLLATMNNGDLDVRIGRISCVINYTKISCLDQDDS